MEGKYEHTQRKYSTYIYSYIQEATDLLVTSQLTKVIVIDSSEKDYSPQSRFYLA